MVTFHARLLPAQSQAHTRPPSPPLPPSQAGCFGHAPTAHSPPPSAAAVSLPATGRARGDVELRGAPTRSSTAWPQRQCLLSPLGSCWRSGLCSRPAPDPFRVHSPWRGGDSCAPLYLQPDAPPAERRSQQPWRTGPSENHQRFPRFPLNRAASCWWAVRSLQRHSGREPLRTRTRRLRGPPWASGLATSPSVPVGAGKLASACHRRQPKPDPGRRRERGPPSGSFLASRELIPDRLSRHPPRSDSPRRVRAPTSPELTRFLLSN